MARSARSKVTAVFLPLTLTVVLLPLPARADPITVTGGTIEVHVRNAEARITLQGDNFFVHTAADEFRSFLAAAPFPLDAALNLGASWEASSFHGGEAIINGVHYPNVRVGPGSRGTFVTPSATLTGSGPATVTVPFMFSGVLTFVQDPIEPIPFFTTSLVGRGTATARFLIDPPFIDPINFERAGFQLEYTFVPEPATLLLIGTGMATMAAGRYRRRSRSREEAAARDC